MRKIIRLLSVFFLASTGWTAVDEEVIEKGPFYKFEEGQWRITIEEPCLAHAETLLLRKIGRIRDVRTGPDGNVYILADHSDGGLYRLQPEG